MMPGLWLEPEVIGVRSPVADRLPAEAFFIRRGQRVIENGRYHLDLRHPAAVKHLDEVIDFVVGDLGVGYLKLDYNINVGPGTDAGNVSAGAGLLAHNRAHLEWLDAVLDRYPGLVIENCASGGMRMDYAMLSRLQLQSTSDQQDFLRYPPITAAAPGRGHPRAGGDVGLPPARLQRPGDHLHAVRRPARAHPPVRAHRPDERGAAAARGRRRGRLQADPGRPAWRAPVLAARPAGVDRLLAGPRHAHPGRGVRHRVAPGSGGRRDPGRRRDRLATRLATRPGRAPRALPARPARGARSSLPARRPAAGELGPALAAS